MAQTYDKRLKPETYFSIARNMLDIPRGCDDKPVLSIVGYDDIKNIASAPAEHIVISQDGITASALDAFTQEALRILNKMHYKIRFLPALDENGHTLEQAQSQHEFKCDKDTICNGFDQLKTVLTKYDLLKPDRDNLTLDRKPA